MAATRSLLVALALAVAPACSDDSDTVIIDDPVEDTVIEGETRGAALADIAYDELVGDDSLVVVGKTASILAALNDGEIITSDFAAQVVIDDDIFAFANDLILDHEDANFELDGTIRFYGIGYIPSAAADALAADANANLGELRGTPPGDIDFRYVEMQVIMHAQALVILDQLFLIVGEGAMGDYILATQDMVADHLARAEDLLASYY